MLASHERGSVSIKSSSSTSSSSSSSSSKPVDNVQSKRNIVSRPATGDTKPIRIGGHDRSDSYSLSSVDVMDSNDLKYMDDSTSSSSASSISGGVDLGSSSASTVSTSPTTAQSSHSQDTLKLGTRSPLAFPLTNGSGGPPSSSSTSPRPNIASVVNDRQPDIASQCSAPVHRPTYMAKPSRIPVLTSLGRMKSSDARNGSEAVSHFPLFINDNSGSENHSPTDSPISTSPRTPVRTDSTDPNGFSSLEPSVESDDAYSHKVFCTHPRNCCFFPSYNRTNSSFNSGKIADLNWVSLR